MYENKEKEREKNHKQSSLEFLSFDFGGSNWKVRNEYSFIGTFFLLAIKLLGFEKFWIDQKLNGKYWHWIEEFVKGWDSCVECIVYLPCHLECSILITEATTILQQSNATNVLFIFFLSI